MNREEILNAVAEMSVLELSEMIKDMEEKFGVSAAAAVAVAAPAGGAACAWSKAHRRGRQWQGWGRQIDGRDQPGAWTRHLRWVPLVLLPLTRLSFLSFQVFFVYRKNRTHS